MKVEWDWVHGQKMMTITLTQHEARFLWKGIDNTNEVATKVNNECEKFYSKGVTS